MIFWRKQQNIEQMLDRYFEEADRCLSLTDEALAAFFDSGVTADFERWVKKIHGAESSADDLRREIEHTLYGKALLPESRGDLLGLLETFDGLPNAAETVAFVLASQGTQLPEDLIPSFRELVDVNMEAYALARKCVDNLFSNPKATLHTTKGVDHKESHSDSIERRIIKEIFKRDCDNGTKMMLKEIVLLIGEISDRAQNVADRIGIVAIKRQI